MYLKYTNSVPFNDASVSTLEEARVKYGPEILASTLEEFEATHRPTTITTGDARKMAMESLLVVLDEETQPLKARYPETERETWATQADEARQLLADPNAPAELIRTIAASLGQDPLDYANLVLARASAFKKVGATVVAERQKASAAIQAASTVDEINAAVEQAATEVRAAVQAVLGQ